MPRQYTVIFENVAVSAAQDLFQILGAAGKILKIKRLIIEATNTALVTAQSLQIRCQFLPVTVTNGSGGSSPTPRPMDPGDSAASFTAKANNTTPASSSGTTTTLLERGPHIYAGLDHKWDPGTEPTIGPSESFTAGLLSTVSGTVNLSGTIFVEEHGG